MKMAYFCKITYTAVAVLEMVDNLVDGCTLAIQMTIGFFFFFFFAS